MKTRNDIYPAAIDFSDSVLGPDLVLTQRDHRLVLHTFDGRRARLLGTYADAVSAWRAIDRLDVSDLPRAA
jgi:hypothetical protein